MVMHTPVMCDRRRDLRSIASEEGIRYEPVLNRNRHLRYMYIKGFCKMGAMNVDRWSEKDPAWYFKVSLVSLWRWSRRFYRVSCNPRWNMGPPLWPRVKTAEQTMEAPWLTPPKKFKRVHSAEKVRPQSFGIVKGWSSLIILSKVAW